MRRLICIVLTALICLSLSPAEAAPLPSEPSRYHFSVGYLALSQAAAQGKAISVTASLQMNETSLLPQVAQEAAAAMAGQIKIQGTFSAHENGGGLDAKLLVGEKSVAEISQRAEGDHVTLCLGDTAICASADEIAEMGGIGDILARLQYEDLLSQTHPVMDLIETQVRTLWGLASPYVEDNDHLSVSSGSTSHGITYKLDNAAFHEVMEAWAKQLPEEIPEVLRKKIEDFAVGAEVRGNLKFNLTYGEGDVLRSARGGGTIRYQDKSAELSFRYTCSLSSTRITRTWRLSYEPSVGDTVNLNLNTLTSSSGNGRAAQEMELSLSGKWDGSTYRIKAATDFLNRYEETEEGLTELLTGNLSASFKYAGEVLLEVKAKRNGNTRHTQTETYAADTWTGTISSETQTYFDGAIMLEMQTGGETLKEELPVPIALSSTDEQRFLQTQALWRDSENQVRRDFLAALDDETMELLLNAY